MDDADAGWGRLFACPSCGAALAGTGTAVACPSGHSFDLAKEGYVNLLLAQHRHSKDPGYNREMIAARRDFFAAGHYERLADEVAESVARLLPPGGVMLDAGCGEGYYLRRLRSFLDAVRPGDDVLLAGTDISKHGIRVAARRDPAGRYAVAGTFRMPVLPGSIDVLLTHFSPVAPADFRRVLRPGGHVVVGGPGPGHLRALQGLLYDAPAEHTPTGLLTAADGFEEVALHRIRYPLTVDGPGQVAQLLAMTPYNWGGSQQRREAVRALPRLVVEVDVEMRVYRAAD